MINIILYKKHSSFFKFLIKKSHFRFEAEKRMDDFSNNTKMEQARLLPERKLLEKKMRSFERGERHGIQSIHEKVKKINAKEKEAR